MATTNVQYQELLKIAEDEYLLLHPETDAAIVKLAVDGIQADNVADALLEINENIAAITGGGVVTGVKGSAETEYRLGNVNITKANIGLGNVDNTSDANKPVSTAQQEALDAKQDKLTFDTAPTASSTNPVTSGGIKTAIDAAKAAVEAEIPDVSSFITKAVNDLTNYYLKTEIDSTVNNLESKISAIPKFAITVVDALPTTGVSATTIYLLKTSTTETGNLYTEYIYVNSAWESLGTQTLDLSGYVTTTALNTALASYAKTTDVTAAINAALANYVTSATLATELAKKQDVLTVDTELSTTSTNPVQNKAVAAGVNEAKTAASAAQTAADAAQTAADTNAGAIDKIVDGTTKVGKAGAADSATAAGKLSTARTIALKGDVTGSVAFDGSANKDITATLANSGVTAGSYSAVTVDAKGRVTKGAQLIEIGEEGQETPSANLAIGGLFLKRI